MTDPYVYPAAAIIAAETDLKLFGDYMTMSISTGNLQSLLTYISSVRGLMRESAEYLERVSGVMCDENDAAGRPGAREKAQEGVGEMSVKRKPRKATKAAKVSAKRARGGSSFDDFLRTEGAYEEAQAVAIKRVIASLAKAIGD